MKENTITQLSASVVINAPKAEVWNVVKDFGSISIFHPLVKQSFSTNNTYGTGAKRYCKLTPMGTMHELVTNWDEGNSFTAKVVGGKMLPPCHFMHGELELKSIEHQTEVGFTFSYQMKFGLLGRIMNMIFIKPQFKKAPLQYVNGLKNYIESTKANLC